MHDTLGPSDSFVARYCAKSDTALYKEAINLLETKIYQEFGLNVLMGAEFEFLVTCNDKLPIGIRANPFRLRTSDAAKAKGYKPSADKILAKQDTLFPKSPYVAYSYQEAQHSFPHYHCESVISHKANYGKMTPDPSLSRMSHFADVLQALKNTVLHGSGGALWSKFREKYVTDVSCKPYDFASMTKSDLHMNYSLVTAKSGKPLSADTYEAMSPFMSSACADGMQLIGATDNHRTRYERKSGELTPVNEEIVIEIGSRRKPAWVEQRLPPADANPHLATLVTLVGIYRGLEALKNQQLSPPPEHERKAHNMMLVDLVDQAQKRFDSPDNVIRRTLNLLDDHCDLGDRLFSRVRAEITSAQGCQPNPDSPNGQAR